MAKQPTTAPTNGRKTRRVKAPAVTSSPRLNRENQRLIKENEKLGKSLQDETNALLEFRRRNESLSLEVRDQREEIGRLREKCDQQTLRTKDLGDAVRDLKAIVADRTAERDRLQGYLNALRDQNGLWPDTNEPMATPRPTRWGPDGPNPDQAYRAERAETRWDHDQESKRKPQWFNLY